MTASNIPISGQWKEAIFQIVLHALVFAFYTFDPESPEIETYQVVFFLNYAVAALIINYLLLPRFFYKKRYLQFFLLVLLIVVSLMLMEELVLEQIFFPDTRARNFPGVMYTLLGILPIIIIICGFKFAWDALGKQQEVEKLKLAVKESQLQYLKSQINPHFLFNNLNNLYSYAIEQSPKAPEIILELSTVLRYMLYECREEYVPLTKEVEQLENFIKLSELQIEERGQINFIEENIQSGYRIAPLILMVFVENAFKHSTASQSDNITIDVKVALSETGTLHFECVNSHQARSNTQQLSKGIGLENVKKRLELLYPSAHNLDIQKRENQYAVSLSIDLNKRLPL